MLFIVRALSVVLLVMPVLVLTLGRNVVRRPTLAVADRVRRWRPPPLRLGGEAGQTTAEYALVIVGAAALALLLITWATKSDAIGKLFDFVLQQVKGRIG
jgi:hypothetical protein